MRKIEEQMNSAIRYGRNFSNSNTQVTHDSEVLTFIFTAITLQQSKEIQSSSKMAVGSQTQLSHV
tara:strand:+ start:4462 stop:4656 length:195 start_codon:yes stop_codon:yes gene_type:complete